MRLFASILLVLTIPLLIPVTAQAQLATPNEKGMTYGHVHLNVTDIELHKQIWVEHFDGVVVQKGPLTAVRMPNMLVALTATAPTGGSRATVMDHFGVKVRNIEKFLAKWHAAGLPSEEPFVGAEGQLNAYVILPDDIIVELQEDQSNSTEISGYHIHFFTPEFESLMAWYVDIFGLEVRSRGTIKSTTNAPGMNMSFANSNTPRLPTRGTGIDHIGFEFDDLEAFCKELEAKGIEFAVPFRDIPAIGLKIAFITDPSGVYIELTQGYDEY